MAILSKGKTFANGELVTPQKLHELVDLGTVSGILNADIANNAAISDTKLATISTANKVAQSAVANLTTDLAEKAATTHTHGNITNAGAIGSTANLPVVTTTSGVLTTLPAGTSGQVLRSNGTSAPSWLTLATSATTDTTSASNITSGTLANARTTATTANTASAIVARDASGNFSAGTIVAALAGNASTATKLATARTLDLTGAVTGSTTFDGSGNASITTTYTAHLHAATDISGRFSGFTFGPSGEIAHGGFEQTTAIGTTVFSDAGRNSVPGAILARWQRTNNSGVTSTIGTITSAGSGSSTTGVAYNTSSDYRLKTNIEPLTAAVARLLQIPVHRFNWLADPAAPKVDGFLAHEAQAIVPESVTGHKDEVDAEGKPIHQGIDQSKLVPLLVAAVQELAERVAALETR